MREREKEREMKLDSTGLRYWMKSGISLGKRNELNHPAKWNHVNCIVDLDHALMTFFIEISRSMKKFRRLNNGFPFTYLNLWTKNPIEFYNIWASTCRKENTYDSIPNIIDFYPQVILSREKWLKKSGGNIIKRNRDTIGSTSVTRFFKHKGQVGIVRSPINSKRTQ